MTSDPTTVAKLNELLAAIRRYPDPRRAGAEWKQVYKLLQKTSLPQGQVTGAVGMRDVPSLVALIDQLSAPPPAPADVPNEDTCREAMKAFRKRLELTVLDEQSKLGRGPLSKGDDAGVVAAIVPPAEWPEPVWRELARQEKIRPIGHGLYELGKRNT